MKTTEEESEKRGERPARDRRVAMIRETASAVADWWAERWEPADTRERFREAVRMRTAEELLKKGEISLHVDYDPDGALLEIIQGIGIECSGNFFSASGLLPDKHATEVTVGRIEPKEGYGNWPPPIMIEGSES